MNRLSRTQKIAAVIAVGASVTVGAVAFAGAATITSNPAPPSSAPAVSGPATTLAPDPGAVEAPDAPEVSDPTGTEAPDNQGDSEDPAPPNGQHPPDSAD